MFHIKKVVRMVIFQRVNRNIWYYCGQNTKYSERKFMRQSLKRSMTRTVLSGIVIWPSQISKFYLAIASSRQIEASKTWAPLWYSTCRISTGKTTPTQHTGQVQDQQVSQSHSLSTLKLYYISEIPSKTGSLWLMKVPLMWDKGALTGEGYKLLRGWLRIFLTRQSTGFLPSTGTK